MYQIKRSEKIRDALELCGEDGKPAAKLEFVVDIDAIAGELRRNLTGITTAEQALKKAASAGTLIFGICGGYQLLGDSVSDPENTEGGGSVRGMELLRAKTVFTPEKRRSRTSGKFAQIEGAFAFLSGAEFSGYEIHMGRTEISGKPLISKLDGTTDGTSGGACGNVCGCYVHGIFDSGEVSSRLVRELFRRKGLEFTGKAVDRYAYKQSQYDLLADSVRESLDMELIYRILREGI